ncbi:MAG: adenosylmethionine decarboxylase [Dehalococcoidia bacterium]
MNVLGNHLLLELKNCDREMLDDLSLVREALISAAEEVGAKILGESFHKFSPQGVTGVLPIAESHLCVHTWPEHGFAAVDVFTCGQTFDPFQVAEFLIGKFKSKDPSIMVVKRGVLASNRVEAAR